MTDDTSDETACALLSADICSGAAPGWSGRETASLLEGKGFFLSLGRGVRLSLDRGVRLGNTKSGLENQGSYLNAWVSLPTRGDRQREESQKEQRIKIKILTGGRKMGRSERAEESTGGGGG